MFLLIRYQRSGYIFRRSAFTFHYVSINTWTVSFPLPRPHFFTFHYVSINTQSHSFLMLCFHTLHSTMFLLILLRCLLLSFLQLSLHFTMFLLILPVDPVDLASTLFTFHYVSINTRSDQHRGKCRTDFTFHYVSINTTVLSTVRTLDLYFTFHYVSINTGQGFINGIGSMTLHSTMFLLILGLTEDY